MKRVLLLSVMLSFLLTLSLHAHELTQSLSRGSAVVVTLSESDGSPFANENYEVFRSGEESPYQSGRTDALGRIVFLPDRHGTWRVRAFSEDGHGIDTKVEAGPEAPAGGAGTTAETRGQDRYSRIAIGIFIILILFAVAMRFFRRGGL